MVDCSSQGPGVVSGRIRVLVPSITLCRRIRRFHEGRGPSPGSGAAAAQRWAAPCPAAMDAGGDELDCLERLDDELLGSHGGHSSAASAASVAASTLLSGCRTAEGRTTRLRMMTA